MILSSTRGFAAGVLALCAGWSCALCDAAPAQDAQPEAASPSKEAAPAPLTVDEAIDQTLALLDRLDARVGEKPSRSELEDLNKYIVAIQRQDPDDPRVNYLYGRAWALMGRPGSAIEQLEKFVETRGGKLEWKAFLTLGDLYVSQFPQLAKGNYEKAAALKPGEPSILYGLSRTYYEIGDFKKALDLARQAVSQDGGVHVVYIAQLARMQAANQDWAEADRTTVRALELAEKYVDETPGQPGSLVVLQEQLDTMINLLRTRVQLPGAGPEEFVRLAKYTADRADVAEKLGKHDAISVLETGLKRFDSQPSAALLEQYGILLATVGRKDDAIKAFHKLQSVDPDNAAAKEWLLRLSAPESSTASRDEKATD